MKMPLKPHLKRLKGGNGKWVATGGCFAIFADLAEAKADWWRTWV
jgi:hypothetical protein